MKTAFNGFRHSSNLPNGLDGEPHGLQAKACAEDAGPSHLQLAECPFDGDPCLGVRGVVPAKESVLNIQYERKVAYISLQSLSLLGVIKSTGRRFHFCPTPALNHTMEYVKDISS